MSPVTSPGDTLASARREAGLTQAALAALAGTSQATISAYESGRKEPSLRTFTRLLALMGKRLGVEEAAHGLAREPSRAELARAGRTLELVLGLAEALPARRRDGELRFPRLAA